MIQPNQNIFEILLENSLNNGDEVFASYSREFSLSWQDLVNRSLSCSNYVSSQCQNENNYWLGFISRTNSWQTAMFLGIWQNNKGVAPLDPNLSADQLLKQIKLLRLNRVFLYKELSNEPNLIELVNLLEDEEDIEVSSLDPKELEKISITSEQLKTNIPAEGPALCICTSGSTGQPKGIPLNHQNLFYGAHYVIQAKSLTSQDKATCVLPLTHINGIVTTFLAPLVSGSKVHFYQGQFDPVQLFEEIGENQCTWLSAIPFHYNLICKKLTEIDKKQSASIRFFRSASAPCPEQTILKIEQYFQIPFVETMGMSETAGQIFSNPIVLGKTKAGYVGLPVGLEVKVDYDAVPASEQTAPPRGELLVRGPSVMPGYLYDEKTTKKAFTDSWLRSGDIVELDDEGFYKICGRIKDIAIFSGENLSLRSLEDTIKIRMGINNIVAKACPSESFGEVIDIYIGHEDCPIEDFEKIISSIENICLDFLPSPSALNSFYLLKSIPRSGVGKVLKGKIHPGDALKSKFPIATETDASKFLARILNVNADEIDETWSYRSRSCWDSLAQVNILMWLENKLNRNLSAQEIGNITTVYGIKALLEERQTNEIDNSQTIEKVIEKLKKAGLYQKKVNYLIFSFDAIFKAGIKNPSQLLEALINQLPKDQTIIMNAFTWSFCRTGFFDRKKSPSAMGLFNEIFRKYPNVHRSNHPIYSYIGIGHQVENLLEHKSSTCWGENSTTLNLLKNKDVRVITFGIDFLYRNPSLHALEEKHQVPYRYTKDFEGIIIMEDKKEKYKTSMYVRNLELNVKSGWQSAIEVFNKEQLAYKNEDDLIYGYNHCDLLKVADQLLEKDKEIFKISF